MRSLRSKWLVVTGLAVATALVGGAFIDQGAGVDRTDPQKGAGVREATTQGRPPDATEAPNPRRGAGERARARVVAQRFLRGFLRYQAGNLGPRTQRVLRRTATRPLVRTLLGRPPRLDRPRNTRGKAGAMTILGPFHGRFKAVARVRYPEGPVGLIELAVERRGAAFHVSRFYP